MNDYVIARWEYNVNGIRQRCFMATSPSLNSDKVKVHTSSDGKKWLVQIWQLNQGHFEFAYWPIVDENLTDSESNIKKAEYESDSLNRGFDILKTFEFENQIVKKYSMV